MDETLLPSEAEIKRLLTSCLPNVDTPHLPKINKNNIVSVGNDEPSLESLAKTTTPIKVTGRKRNEKKEKEKEQESSDEDTEEVAPPKKKNKATQSKPKVSFFVFVL